MEEPLGASPRSGPEGLHKSQGVNPCDTLVITACPRPDAAPKPCPAPSFAPLRDRKCPDGPVPCRPAPQRLGTRRPSGDRTMRKLLRAFAAVAAVGWAAACPARRALARPWGPGYRPHPAAVRTPGLARRIVVPRPRPPYSPPSCRVLPPSPRPPYYPPSPGPAAAGGPESVLGAVPTSSHAPWRVYARYSSASQAQAAAARLQSTVRNRRGGDVLTASSWRISASFEPRAGRLTATARRA
jgi:hypothetical protein